MAHSDAAGQQARGRYISLQEAADRLTVDKRTIRRRIADGLLPAYSVAGTRAVRVRVADVEALLVQIPTVDGAA